MPVPHILAGTAGGTTAQFDANFAYLAALRDLFSLSGGNLSLTGAAPQAWGTNHKALEIGAGSSGHLIAPANNLTTGANYYSTNSADKYVGAAPAVQYVQNGNAGTHSLRTAVTGTAGADITWVEQLRLTAAGTVHFPAVGTTASAANAHLASGASPANQLLRSTSSLRYKTDVRDLPESYRGAVMALRPVVYKSNAPADDGSVDWVGLIAEEVAEHAPRLVHYTRLTEDSPLVPDGVQYDRLAVVLLAEVQALRARVAALESAV